MTRVGWALAWQSLLVPRLEQVRADHARAILAFERENRAYFATWISDRGDEYFDQFTARHRELLAEQDAGECAFYVLVEGDGAVLGRFNLYDIQDGAAKLGYRVAQRVAGCGVATTSVGELCEIAKSLGVGALTAATSHENVASQKVLKKAGFVPDGPADPSELGGKEGLRYRRDLPAT
jgi:[ribosomal protein S5]-alanine N-acetyltransferase